MKIVVREWAVETPGHWKKYLLLVVPVVTIITLATLGIVLLAIGSQI